MVYVWSIQKGRRRRWGINKQKFIENPDWFQPGFFVAFILVNFAHPLLKQVIVNPIVKTKQ